MSPNLFGNMDETHSMKSPEVVYPRDLPGTQVEMDKPLHTSRQASQLKPLWHLIIGN